LLHWSDELIAEEQSSIAAFENITSRSSSWLIHSTGFHIFTSTQLLTPDKVTAHHE
jgi:hypothetical protein